MFEILIKFLIVRSPTLHTRNALIQACCLVNLPGRLLVMKHPDHKAGHKDESYKALKLRVIFF